MNGVYSILANLQYLLLLLFALFKFHNWFSFVSSFLILGLNPVIALFSISMKKVVFYINVEFVSNANLIQTLACSPWKNQVRWLCASHLSSNSLYNTTFLFLSIAKHFFYQNLCSSNAFINRFCISYVCFASIFRMVKLVAKTFYDNYTPKNNNQKKSAKNGSGGIAVLVLDALTRFVCTSSVSILKILLGEF